MREEGSSNNAWDDEAVSGCDTEGEMDIDMLQFSSRGLRSFVVQVCGECCHGFEIGWVNSVRVVLYYDHIEIGKMSLRNTTVIPDGDDRVSIPEDHDYEHRVSIKHMGAFRAMFDDVLPKKSVAHQVEDTKPTTAALFVSPDGFGLKMRVNVARMPRMKCAVKMIRFSGNEISIVMNITNSSPLKLPFENDEVGDCQFVLKKGNRTVGDLLADFTIEPGESEFLFHGSIHDGVSGVVTLKGVKYKGEYDEESNWQHYVIRSFETEIDLGERRDEAVKDNEEEME
ncbi:hypothetical protein BBK36DRAFT_1115701 [Trichoderma citrinoviride]|uniref:Uncharacterized protein n=1 Tax=Trichoderma citrinoviride TaxID=58853 RepID=A0A2T4BE19_9HYPO|nr:hypothetical protein BBK36DRAFT_1115701 [Trichoderma citrinoviride]PTB67518.1 hypothetical protein BBK36DRAFT_1115701 [Trichoderma citrinoviride]